MSTALTPLQALVILHGECEKSLDFRPSLRKAMAEAYIAIVNAPLPAPPALHDHIELGAPIETDESFALSVSEVMSRVAPREIAALFGALELEP